MGGQTDLLEDRLGRALHPDLLGPGLERAGSAVEQVASGVGRVGLLDEQVLGVRSGVRGAPRDARVVTERDRRDARERGARHVVRAGIGDRRAMESVQEPDRRHRDPEVRVVRKERAAGRGQARRDDPVVRAHAMRADHAVTEVQPRDAPDRIAEIGDRAPAGRLRFRRLATGDGWRDSRHVRRIRRARQGRARSPARRPDRVGTARRCAQGRRGGRRRGTGTAPRPCWRRRSTPGPSASRPSRAASTVPVSCPSAGTRGPRLSRSWSSHALTPCAYASRTARASGVIAARSRSVACRQPSVRMKRSVSSWLSPNISARRPAEMCRQTSICHIRSCAWTKPWAMNRSCTVSARMWAMPATSRTTVTGRSSPGTVSVPLVCGSARPVNQARAPTPAPTTTSTTTSSTASTRLSRTLLPPARSPLPPDRAILRGRRTRQRGSSTPRPRSVARRTIASANTTSARPTPRCETTTRPAAGRCIPPRIASPSVARGSG